jgi:hypothetical protein
MQRVGYGHCVSPTLFNDSLQMFVTTITTAGDHRNVHGISDRTR